MQSLSLKKEGWNGDPSTSQLPEIPGKEQEHIIRQTTCEHLGDNEPGNYSWVWFVKNKSRKIILVSFHGSKTGLMLRWAVMDVMCRDFIKESQLPRDGVGNAPHCGKPSQTQTVRSSAERSPQCHVVVGTGTVLDVGHEHGLQLWWLLRSAHLRLCLENWELMWWFQFKKEVDEFGGTEGGGSSV